MSEINGFNSLGHPNARILILGSMPGVVSLDKQHYYAHPRNAFWPIMASLFNHGKPLTYLQGQKLLLAQRIAVWDVLKSCVRQGSLDSAIEKNSMEINDFVSFFRVFNQIRYIFFNGGTAELVYKKYVWPKLPMQNQTLNYAKLPSTSPAYAAMSYEDKLAAWAVLQIPK